MLLMHEDEDNIKDILATQVTTPSLTYLAFHHNNIRCARWLLSVGVQLVDGGSLELVLAWFILKYILATAII